MQLYGITTNTKNLSATNIAPQENSTGYTGESDTHTHAIQVLGGDEETRPDNIALYIYIKIDEKPAITNGNHR